MKNNELSMDVQAELAEVLDVGIEEVKGLIDEKWILLFETGDEMASALESEMPEEPFSVKSCYGFWIIDRR